MLMDLFGIVRLNKYEVNLPYRQKGLSTFGVISLPSIAHVTWAMFNVLNDIIPWDWCDNMYFYYFESTKDRKSGYVYFAFEYQISSRLIGPLQVSLSLLLVFYQSSNFLKLIRAPATSLFCANSTKNAFGVPKFSNKTEILHLKGEIWEFERSDQ